jgi:hypothetical protein
LARGRSEEYKGCASILMPCRYCCTRRDKLAGALSWWSRLISKFSKIKVFAVHNFLQMAHPSY